MAMDFPSSPTDGQIFGNFVWSSSTGAWKSRPQLQQVVTYSSATPASPNTGDIWINTNTGVSYHYLDDGTSKQWVEFLPSSSQDYSPVKLNMQTISYNYSIPSGYNGYTSGPVTIANGITVTIPDGSSWSVI